MVKSTLITVKGQTDGKCIRSIHGGIFNISNGNYNKANGYFMLLSKNSGISWVLLKSVWLD